MSVTSVRIHSETLVSLKALRRDNWEPLESVIQRLIRNDEANRGKMQQTAQRMPQVLRK